MYVYIYIYIHVYIYIFIYLFIYLFIWDFSVIMTILRFWEIPRDHGSGWLRIFNTLHQNIDGHVGKWQKHHSGSIFISIKMMVKQTMSGDSPAHWDIFASHTLDSLIEALTTTFQVGITVLGFLRCSNVQHESSRER